MEGVGEMDFQKGRWILSFDCYDSNTLTASGNKLYVKQNKTKQDCIGINFLLQLSITTL